MKGHATFFAQHLLALLLCTSIACAQTTPPLDTQPVYTQAELDQMLAPIALYPDALLSQILMASTYPMEVVLAARWSRSHRNLSGEEAVHAVEGQDWDPSVKSLVAFPQILDMMDQKLEWTQRLGDAFLAQQQQVMDTVQQLRQKALAAGNLQSNRYVQVVPQGPIILIEPVNPQVLYVPYYDPMVVYGTWWWPAFPPIYWGPWPGYYAPPGVSVGLWWGVGIRVGVGFFFGAFDWPHHHVTVVEVHNFYYRPRPPLRHVPPGTWWHDPGHRRGVPYRDPVVRERFSRHDARADLRREYRGIEPSRLPAPATPGIRRDERTVPESQRERERVRPDAGERVRPSAPEVSPPEPRTAPRRPDSGAAPTRPSAPDTGRPELRTVPSRPNARLAPERPRVEPQPNIFEGLGRGRAVRDFSARGRASSGVPVQPQRAAPAPRPGGNVSPQKRPSGGARRDSGDTRPQQR